MLNRLCHRWRIANQLPANQAHQTIREQNIAVPEKAARE